ncbi:solute carrier family 12 member 8 isoform X2 [Camelus ferus]|uniref:Solute carrier family 12 member 8 isoform X2 n=1 Tax=Camelus ferus TaxID=419612 RepID=A0A8B8T403_CAMFR|nr:solute carrier family 12 member 8 isoform X2 [Camelus ferus]XP_032336733.1 solute carrier family 12 member 8 isoform X2 [Camelus ferus]
MPFLGERIPLPVRLRVTCWSSRCTLGSLERCLSLVQTLLHLRRGLRTSGRRGLLHPSSLSHSCVQCDTQVLKRSCKGSPHPDHQDPHFYQNGPDVSSAGTLPRGSPAGGPGPAPALVEDPAVHVGASAVRDLGWCVHVLHDQHFWGGSLLEDRLAGGKYRSAHGHVSGVLRRPGGPGPRAVRHRGWGALRRGQRRRLLHDRRGPRRADRRHDRAAVRVWTGAMYITGFAESISDLLSLRNIWAVRGISVAVLLALLGINLAGVKWIIRLQLLLLLLLAVSTLDFVVGSFSHLDPEHGFIGYSPELLQNNSLPEYSPGESFFTVFGVFFPAATGVMAGFNMGGDLREPAASIPLGSLAAVGISWFLYIVFVFLLGAICTREALRYDFLIAEKVSLVGFLFLLGLYISSLASCMGGLYGAPRILQCIAQEKVIPALACLGQGKGPNKTPVAAICLTSLVTMAFVLVGQVNVLAPIVTINFMLTYIAVDYSYFSLSMGACSLPQVPESVSREGMEALHCSEHLLLERAPSYGSEGVARSLTEGTLLEFTKDMDQLLQLTSKLESSQPRGGESHGIPENQKGKTKKATKQALQDSFLLDLRSPASFPPEGSDRWPAASWEGQEPYRDMQGSRSEGTWPGEACGGQLFSELSNQPRASGEDFFPKSGLQEKDIQRPTSFYSRICNPWVSLLGAFGSLLIMFVIQWVYTLVNIGVAAIVYFYIGRTSPGLHLGLASNFSLFRWMKSLLIPSCRNHEQRLYLASDC